MIALFYLLGFLSGAAATALAGIIVNSVKRGKTRGSEDEFFNIINY